MVLGARCFGHPSGFLSSLARAPGAAVRGRGQWVGGAEPGGGAANRAYPADELDAAVLAIAERVARIPPDLLALNKRAARRAMDAMGIRAGIRAGTEMQQLAFFTDTTRAYFKEMSKGLTHALSKRDEAFGDYRTSASGKAED